MLFSRQAGNSGCVNVQTTASINRKRHVIVLFKLTMLLTTPLVPNSPHSSDGPLSLMKATPTTDVT